MFSLTSLQANSNNQLNGLQASSKLRSLSDQVNQSLLTFTTDDTVNILIDVGWDPALSSSLDHILALAPEIDLILLTHASINHVGAYAYLCKISPEFAAIPTYSTLPVINMSRIVTLDYYRSAGLLGPLMNEKVTLFDVEAAFDNVLPLKYSQSTHLQDKLDGFTITPYNAGHTLGGTLWKIQRDQESILYAVDWNHSRDSHLNGAFLQSNGKILDALTKPSIMICGSKISERPATLKRRKESLFVNIKETIRRGGSVLIPTSSGARVLELCHILDSFWEDNKISAPLVYFSHLGYRTLSYASSMLEWMSSAVIDEWEVHNNSPFDTKHLKVYSDLDELAKLDGPKVVLASGEALETGFSRGLFTKMCDGSNSLVILTERAGGTDSLNGQLYSLWNGNSGASEGAVQLTTQMLVDYNEEVKLKGEELIDYTELIREEKRKKEIQTAIDLRNKNILEEEDDEDNESSDDEEDEMVLSGQLDTGILIYGQGVYDYDARPDSNNSATTAAAGTTGDLKHNIKPKMFPFVSKRRRVDDYGEVIKSDQFSTKAKDKEDLLLVAGGAPGGRGGHDDAIIQDAKVGEKRQWGDINHRGSVSGDTLSNGGANGRNQAGRDKNNKNSNDRNENDDSKADFDSDESLRLDSFSAIAVPKKMVPNHKQVKVLCRVDFIDFEGLTDERSMKMILPLVQPRQLVFLNNNGAQSYDSGSTNTFNQDGLIEYLQTKKIEIIHKLPTASKSGAGARIDIKLGGSNIYKVEISSELEKLLKWQKIIGDYSVAHVTGKLKAKRITPTPSPEPVAKKEEDNVIKPEGDVLKPEGDAVKTEGGVVKTEPAAPEVAPAKPAPTSNKQGPLLLVPLETAREVSLAPRTNPILVGDIKLAELKRKLFRQFGLRSEFGAEGILVIFVAGTRTPKLAIRKLGEGNIVVEGVGVDEDFYKVKSFIRSMLASV
jgi:cleavage and polyadenylation specificity factor subunit 2